MPRVIFNKNKYLISDFYENLKLECKRYGITQEMQAELLGITKQCVCYHYRNHSFSLEQYLLIESAIKERKDKREALRNG